MKQITQWKEQISLKNLWRKYSAISMIIILVIFFNLFGTGFQTLENYENIILNNTALVLAVIGLSFIMIGGGIDLSIGYQISMVSAVISILSIEQLPDWMVVLGVLLIGFLCGLMNGILVAYLNIVPFAATIATQIIFRGISYMISGGSMVSYIAQTIRGITKTYFLGVRIDVWLLILGFLVFWCILHGTFAGKYLRAIGLNEEIAVRAGVKTKRIKCFSYCIASIFYTIAAMILISRRGYAGSEIGQGMEITAISAAYIGGVLTLAEKQSIITLFLGTLVVAVIENGLTKVGINSSLQYIITGIILIIAMTIQRKQKKI